MCECGTNISTTHDSSVPPHHINKMSHRRGAAASMAASVRAFCLPYTVGTWQTISEPRQYDVRHHKRLPQRIRPMIEDLRFSCCSMLCMMEVAGSSRNCEQK